jgi:hypothetical protein
MQGLKWWWLSSVAENRINPSKKNRVTKNEGELVKTNMLKHAGQIE